LVYFSAENLTSTEGTAALLLPSQLLYLWIICSVLSQLQIGWHCYHGLLKRTR